mgnify:CR=1 FL=1
MTNGQTLIKEIKKSDKLKNPDLTAVQSFEPYDILMPSFSAIVL